MGRKDDLNYIVSKILSMNDEQFHVFIQSFQIQRLLKKSSQKCSSIMCKTYAKPARKKEKI